MRIHIVACRVLTRELSALAATSDNHIDISWLPQGMHDTPTVLHQAIVDELERIYSQIERKQLRIAPDYILLGYGLCSKAVVDLEAKDIPLVVPRTEDCIALFLGSQKKYLDCFENLPGTYWFNSEWIENTPSLHPGYTEQLRKHYMERYGDEDTVEYLLEMDKAQLANYKYVGYIASQVHDSPSAREIGKKYAENYGLEYVEVEGDNRMIRKMVDGDFTEDEFLIVPPGKRVAFTLGPERVVAV